MILEVKMGAGRENGSESSKRPAKYSNSFPLKKRRIMYEEEVDTDLNTKESTPSLQLETSEPENLSTKPQDLRISNPQFKREIQSPAAFVPSRAIPAIKTESVPVSYRGINAFTPNDQVFYHGNREASQPVKISGPLEPISLNAPTLWSPPTPYIPYNFHAQSQFYPPPYPHHIKVGDNGRMLNFELEHFTPRGCSPSCNSPPQEEIHDAYPALKRRSMCPPELRNHHLETRQLSKGIKKEGMESPRHPPRDSVISHSNHHHFPQFQVGLTHQHRDTLSRSSYDSGVSSPSGSSTHSTISTPSVTPTLVGGSLRYACPTCQKSYSTVSGLSKHVQFHCASQNKKSFICKDCDKVYTSLGALKMHIRTHTLPCKCNVCGKAFSRPWLLQGHIRTHTGEKPFGCQHCQRAFADRSNLRAHLQTHSELKKYSCKQCAKTFSRMSLLTKHQDTGCTSSSN